MMKRSTLLAGFCAFALVAMNFQTAAQHAGHHSATAASPYAGFEKRQIKALSETQVDDLKAGRGMGLALAAELNGYPGPVHVLELADKLDLSPAQKAHMATLVEAMKQETIAIGSEVIEAETRLDNLFRGKQVNAETLAASVRHVAHTQGRLREAHLRYHLDTRDVLRPEQIGRYISLRGYAAEP